MSRKFSFPCKNTLNPPRADSCLEVQLWKASTQLKNISNNAHTYSDSGQRGYHISIPLPCPPNCKLVLRARQDNRQRVEMSIDQSMGKVSRIFPLWRRRNRGVHKEIYLMLIQFPRNQYPFLTGITMNFILGSGLLYYLYYYFSNLAPQNKTVF